MKSIESQLFLWALLLLGLCCLNPVKAQQNTITKNSALMNNDTVLGIKIKLEAVELLQRVEALYKTKIKQIIVDKDPSLGAEAEVEEDGTPVLMVNKNGGITEVNIVHELWHLYQDAQTDPKVYIGGPMSVLVPSITEQNKVDFLQLMYDPIIHTCFYPKMRKMGYEPDINEKRHFEKLMETPNPPVTPLGAAMSYFKVSLEIKDKRFKKRVEEWYKKNKWEPYLEQGKELVKVFESINPDTPEKQIDVFVKCMNILLEGTAKFEVYKWEPITQGAIKRNAVYISILPPSK